MVKGLVLSVLAVACLADASADIIRGKGDYRDGKIAVDLVSEVKSIRAGEPFTVGVKIIHAPGWHTYWKSPGVAGVPTVLEWDMPEGFTAEPFDWPAPQRSIMAGMTVYGYEGECLLPMKIHPPANLKPDKDGKVRLKVRAAWMTCEVSCHPGWQDFVLTLPVTDGQVEIDGEWRQAFEQARARIPVPAPAGWKFAVQRTEEKVILTVTLPEKLKEATKEGEIGKPYFFAEKDLVESTAPQLFQSNPDGSFSITMKISEYAKEGTKQLKGVLEFENSLLEGDKGPSRWMRVVVPWEKS